MAHNYTLRDSDGGRLVDGVSMDRLLDKVAAIEDWPETTHYRVTDHSGSTVLTAQTPERVIRKLGEQTGRGVMI